MNKNNLLNEERVTEGNWHKTKTWTQSRCGTTKRWTDLLDNHRIKLMERQTVILPAKLMEIQTVLKLTKLLERQPDC